MNQDLSQIIAYLNKTRNLDFTGCRESMLERHISKRFIPTDSNGFSDYNAYIKAHPEELDNLIQVLTINVSWFFRDALTFEFLSGILDDLVKKKMEIGDRWFRVWSAGCSTGEEAYSLAIIINDFLHKEQRKFRLNIFATDIDNKALSIAEAGSYSAEAVQNVKQGQIAAYFSLSGSKFEVDPSIKALVDFSYHDLLDRKNSSPPESVFGNFDLILCRNVLIYFDPEHQERIFDKFYKSLNKEGFLVLGESEVPVGKYKTHFVRENSCCRIYRKYL